MSEVAALDPERIVRTLDAHDVAYVLIDQLAARLHGSPRLTADAGITPAWDRENLERLAAALREMNARVFTEAVPEGLPFDCSAPTLGRADFWNLTTDAGRIDIAFVPSGANGYADLLPGAVRYEVFGVDLLVAGLADIIRSKESADRPKDRQDVILLKEILERYGRDPA